MNMLAKYKVGDIIGAKFVFAIPKRKCLTILRVIIDGDNVSYFCKRKGKTENTSFECDVSQDEVID